MVCETVAGEKTQHPPKALCIYQDDSSFTQMPFPKKLPFSEFVPKVYSQLKEFIYACLKYSEDLHLR